MIWMSRRCCAANSGENQSKAEECDADCQGERMCDWNKVSKVSTLKYQGTHIRLTTCSCFLPLHSISL